MNLFSSAPPFVLGAIAVSLGAILWRILAAVRARHDGTGLLGQRIDWVRSRSDLFRFFHLQPMEQTPASVVFKPAGAAFRDKVTVTVGIDSRAKIQSVEAVLHRNFIDSPRDGVFARDLAQSLLAQSLPTKDRVLILALIRDIRERGETNGLVLRRVGHAIAELTPRPPAPGYDVFLGVAPQFSRDLSLSTVTLVNQGADPDRILRVSVRWRSQDLADSPPDGAKLNGC